MLVRGENGVEDLLDFSVRQHQCQPLEQPHAVEFKGRQAQRVGKSKIGIAEYFEWKMQARDHFLLILRGLRAETEDLCFQVAKLLIVIAERAALRCAPARAWDFVPIFRDRLSGRSRARVTIYDRSLTRELRQV